MTREEAIKHLSLYVGNDCYTDRMQMACKMAIAALREQESAENAHCNSCKKCNSWIPVTERLPEDGVDVLTRRAVGMSVEAHCGWGWTEDGYHTKWRVTHWMPLPDAPEVEV